MGTIGSVGGRNMAEALIKGIVGAGIYKADEVLVSDARAERLDYLTREYGVKTSGENREVAGAVEVVVLSVKPQNMGEVLEGIKGAVRADGLVISIAAGITVKAVTDVLGDRAMVRVMPNTPALIGEGASALFANAKGKGVIGKAEAIFSSVGEVVEIETEDLMDAVTAVSGSGPAYYFLLAEEMIKAGVAMGLSEDVCKRLVLQTGKGAALLARQAEERGQSVSELRRKVTSPGGTTEAAMKEFAEGGFGALVAGAIEKARDRGRELAK